MRGSERVRPHPPVAVGQRDADQRHRLRMMQEAGGPVRHGRVGLAIGGLAELVHTIGVQAAVDVHARAALPGHRLGHERGPMTVLHRHLLHDGREQHGVVGGGQRIAGTEVDLELARAVFGVRRLQRNACPQQGGTHGGNNGLEFQRIGQRAVLHVLLDGLPVGSADVALELGGDHRIEPELVAPRYLSMDQTARIQRVRPAVFVERVGHDDGVPRPMRQQPEAAEIWCEVHVEETGAHVDDGRVDDLALHVEHIDGVGDVDPTQGDTGDEPRRGHSLAAQMPVGIDRPDLDRMDAVLGDLLGDGRQHSVT